jgi:hypothetical protein
MRELPDKKFINKRFIKGCMESVIGLAANPLNMPPRP